MKILIIKLRAIGDVLLSTPVIENLRRAYNSSRIDFLVERDAEDVVKGNPYVDRVIVLDRKRMSSLGESLNFMKGLREGRYDLTIDLFGNPRSALLTLCTGAKLRVGYNFRGRRYAYNLRVEPRGDRVHEVQFNLDALRKIGVPVLTDNPLFPLDDVSKRFARDFFKSQGLEDGFVIGVSPSGGWSAKRWPLEYFAELADQLVKTYGAKILLFWGPGELIRVQRLQSFMTERSWIIPKTTLKQLGALLWRCDLVISNDSGPMHIAAALGTPTTGIFGPTNPQLQGPYGEKHEVVAKEGLLCLGCNKLTCKTSDCMNLLGPGEVFQVVRRCIEKNSLL